MHWLSAQLIKATATAKEREVQELRQQSEAAAEALRRQRGIRRPAGVFRQGSATEAVLAYLLERREELPAQYWTNFQIRTATGRTALAVDSALAYLVLQEVVESESGDGRNPRYRRYRATSATHLAGKKRRGASNA